MGLDIIGFGCYNNDLMEIDNSNYSMYILIDWNRPAPHPMLSPPPIKMTEKEVHLLNQAMATNKQTKRYVKLES